MMAISSNPSGKVGGWRARMTPDERLEIVTLFVHRHPIPAIHQKTGRSVSAIWNLVADDRLEEWVGRDWAKSARAEAERRRRVRGRSGKKAKEMAARYLKGDKVEVIALEMDVDYATVYRVLCGLQSVYAIDDKTRAAVNAERQRRRSEFSGAVGKRADIELAIVSGKSVSDIAKEFGCSTSWVRRVRLGKRK